MRFKLPLYIALKTHVQKKIKKEKKKSRDNSHSPGLFHNALMYNKVDLLEYPHTQSSQWYKLTNLEVNIISCKYGTSNLIN